MRILVTDDDASTRTMLESWLTEWGYDVVTAQDGDEAWNILQAPDTPSVAMLDWMMPGRAGIDLCRSLKAKAHTSFVYIILITGKEEGSALSLALDSGAHDFIRKPCQREELKSRVAVGVRVAEQDRRLREFANHMETIANDRARQLIHADRMASLGIMAAGIVHEVNNPLTMVSGNLQLLEKFWEDLPALVAHGANTPEDEMKLAFIRKELPGVVQGMRKGVTMISRITSALRTYSRKESGNILPCDLNSCISDALEVTGHIFGKKGVAVKADLAPSLPLFMGNAHQIEQVLINLFINAADAMEEADKRELSIATSFDGQRLKTVVQDTGPGVPVSIIDKIWLPFFTTKTSGKGTGLGLSVSQTIMQAHGGTISVANASPAGAVFTLLLPVGRN